LDSLVVKQSKLNSAIAFQRQQAFFFRYAWANFKIRYLKGVLSRALESNALLSGDFFGDEPHSRTFGTLARYLFFRAIGAKGVLSNLAVAATLAGALVQNNCVSFFSSKYCVRGFCKRDARFRLFFCKGSFRSLYFRSGGRRVRGMPSLSKRSLYFRQVSFLKARLKVRSFSTLSQNTVWLTTGRTVLSSATNLFAPRFSR
jgi:hypothetical protein